MLLPAVFSLVFPYLVLGLQCGLNEEPGCWNSCEVQCPRSDLPAVTYCPSCKNGCVCATGYVRDIKNGLCIGQHYCPLFGDPCETHETFSMCGAMCQPTCISPYHMNPCPVCVPGYVCSPGYMRDPSSGLCVLYEECSQQMRWCAQREQQISALSKLNSKKISSSAND